MSGEGVIADGGTSPRETSTRETSTHDAEESEGPVTSSAKEVFAAALERATHAGNRSAIHALEMVASLPATDVHRMDVVRTWGKTEDVSDNPLLLYLAPLLLRHTRMVKSGRYAI